MIQQLTRQRDELLSMTNALSEEQIGKIHVTDADGWTIKGVFGHISYWEQVTLDHIRQSFTEGKPRPMSPKDPETNINARESKKRRGWKWARMRAEFENTRGALIERVTNLNEMELSFIIPNPWWNDQDKFYSIDQMIEKDTLAHAAEHLAQIQRAIETDRNP